MMALHKDYQYPYRHYDIMITQFRYSKSTKSHRSRNFSNEGKWVASKILHGPCHRVQCVMNKSLKLALNCKIQEKSTPK